MLNVKLSVMKHEAVRSTVQQSFTALLQSPPELMETHISSYI